MNAEVIPINRRAIREQAKAIDHLKLVEKPCGRLALGAVVIDADIAETDTWPGNSPWFGIACWLALCVAAALVLVYGQAS